MKARKRPTTEKAAWRRRTLTREKSQRRQLRAALDAGRDQQAATAEILRLVSTSPGDAQPVFDAIARHAVRLCASRGALVVRYDGALLHLAAQHNVAPEALGWMESYYPVAPDPNTLVGRAVLGGGVVHVPDLRATTEFQP
jgi:hypothetical protein